MGQNLRKKVELSDWNRLQLNKHFSKVSEHAKAILEIGVCRNDDKSSTWSFINNKRPDAFYFGVDIEDKSFLDSEENNVFTLKTSSSNFEEIMKFVNSKGIEKFDFIFIDGWHSVSQVLKEWRFVEYLSDFGIVCLHDTNYHPGPRKFVNALNPERYLINKTCKEKMDWGITFITRR